LKRRGGVPSGAARIIAIEGLALSEITGIAQLNMKIGDLTSFPPEGIQFSFCMLVAPGIMSVFMGNLKISTNLRITWYRRGQCLSSRTDPTLCNSVDHLWNYRSKGDAIPAGTKVLRAVAQKER